MRLIGFGMAAALLVTGCVAPAPVFPQPPSLPTEAIPLPPVSDERQIWQPGDWIYTGGSYRYEAGRYVPAAGHGTNWVFAHWSGTPAGYTWVPGGWY